MSVDWVPKMELRGKDEQTDQEISPPRTQPSAALAARFESDEKSRMEESEFRDGREIAMVAMNDAGAE